MKRFLWGPAVSLSLLACGGGASPGAPAGPDAGPFSDDASWPLVDAGASDASESPDADAGPLRIDVPLIACADATSDVYVTPALPPFDASRRGDVVRCAHDVDLATSDVAAQTSGLATKPMSAVHVYRVAFRTTRGDGSGGVSTARVFLPVTPRSLPSALVVVGHPSDGMADACAPSKSPTADANLALSWAGQGLPVIVPDYVGLGNGGVQAYLDNHEQGQTILDGARALRAMLPKAALDAQILAVGYSQGGGAVLSAQALERTYGSGGILKGVVAFAPQWPTRDNSFGYVDMLRSPSDLTITTGISRSPIMEMRQYAYFGARVGLANAGDSFPEAKRAGMVSAIQSDCLTTLGAYVETTDLHLGDLIDDSLRTALLSCIDTKGASCEGAAKGYYDFLEQNYLVADKNGAPVLFVQGLADQIMVANQEAACNIDKLAADGLTPQVCTDATATHTTIVASKMDFALAWGTAMLSGAAAPSCDGSGMPACSP